jgi:ribosomal-protein-alanine N-acetyltransferase
MLPPYDSYPTVANDAVRLRPIRSSDIAEVVEISFYDARPAQSIEQASEMQARIDEDYANGNTIHWGIEDLSTGRLVGTCGYYRGFAHATGELGCVLRPAFRGQGFMTQAMALAIAFGRAHMGLARIIAVTTHDNAPAIRLLERLHFRPVCESTDGDLTFELDGPSRP